MPFTCGRADCQAAVWCNGGLYARLRLRIVPDLFLALSFFVFGARPHIVQSALPWRRSGPAGPGYWAISEFPKWRKYLILLSFLDNSSARPVQIGGVVVNICHSRSTAVRGRRRSSSQSPPRGPFCRTRTGPVEADGAVDAQNAPTAPWKTLCVFHELPQGLSHQVTHEKLRKAPEYRWETRIDPIKFPPRYRRTSINRGWN